MSLKPRSRGIASAIWRGRLLEHARQTDRLVHRRLDLVEAEIVGDLFGVVDDVVERRGEREDVLAINRRDERVVEAIDDVVRDPIALVLAVEDLLREVLVLGVVGEHRVEQIRGAHHVLARLLEQLEVDAITRGEHLGEASHTA